jgi:Co/Zn/Cd efflux system component
MAGRCCCQKTTFDGLSPTYRRVLWLVILLNGGMFLLEMAAGLSAQSRSLQADALDFLGDTATYGLSLMVIGLAPVIRARAAMVKGISLLLMGAWVLGNTIHHVFTLGRPEAHVMGVVGVLALATNLACVLLLMKWRDGDANVRSVWLCSRNDAIGNLAVLLAASGVWATDTAWPDLMVAAIMAGLFLSSSWRILKQAREELATTTVVSAS